jgi:hypothetical protein
VSQAGYHDMDKIFNSIENKHSTTLAVIKEAYYLHIRNNKHQGMSIVIDNVVTTQDFKDKNGNIYYSTKDVVLSMLSLLEAPAHPYSEGVLSGRNFNSGIEEIVENDGVGVYFELIDNTATIGNRYIFIAKQVRVLIPKTSDTRPNGLYVTTIERDFINSSRQRFEQTVYKLDECEEKLGVYKTQEEALNDGDIKLGRKEEIARLEHESLLMKNEYATYKTKTDAEIARANAELARTKHESEMREHKAKMEEIERERELRRENDRLDQAKRKLEDELDREKARTKDWYEQRSYHRKDNSEIVKFLPAMILGIGAVVVAFNKLTEKSSK